MSSSGGAESLSVRLRWWWVGCDRCWTRKAHARHVILDRAWRVHRHFHVHPEEIQERTNG